MKTASTTKYDFYVRLFRIMGHTAAFLALACIYAPYLHPDFYLQQAFFVVFLLSIGAFMLQTWRDKHFYKYFLDKDKTFRKTPIGRIIAIIVILAVIVRFFVPDDALLYIQAAFVIAATIFMIFGIMNICRRTIK